MTRNKTRIQKIIVGSFFLTLLVFSSTIAITNHSIVNNNTVFNTDSTTNPQSSNVNINDFINGTGNNQEARVYLENQSTSLGNNNGTFNISSPGNNTYLSNSDFLFEFQNNYTTDYTLENNNSLELKSDKYIKYNFDNSKSGFTLNNGTNINSGTFQNLVNTNEFIHLNATNGLINFTINANYSGKTFKLPGGSILNFNRSQILGFILLFMFNLSLDANLTVNMWNSQQNSWKNVIEKFQVNSSLGEYSLNRRIIDQFTNLIDQNDTAYIQFLFERNDKKNFDITLNNFQLTSVYAFDIPISNQNQVALEFPLKGKSTLVHGFYAWIRTLNPSETVNTELNITLYKANTTVNQRTSGNLQQNNLRPEQVEKEYSIILHNYNSDAPYYFQFNQSKIINLGLWNYFIVIKSNRSQSIYSLISIPYSTFGDQFTEHELRISSNGGISWKVAKKIVNQDYTSEPLDASNFAINVTRGYMPSDFNVSGNSLNIQNITVQDTKDYNIYPNRFPVEWGVGAWNNSFTNPIISTITNEFTIHLNWTKTITNDFYFNVTYYAKSYSKQQSKAIYTVYYNGLPEWNLFYNLDLNSSIFNNWNFTGIWYIFPNYFNPQQLIDPNNQQILEDINNKSQLEANSNFDKLIIPSSIAISSGTYMLNLTSFNAISNMSSYINFKGNLWRTSGFMYGDNISTSMKIIGPSNLAPKNGIANVSLYFPNGTFYKKLSSSVGSLISDNSTLFYDFNNATILNLTKSIPILGKYYLGFFWNNGSSIGCKKVPIFITDYNIKIYGANYNPQDDENTISGRINKIVDTYTMLTATVNKTSQYNPGFYPVNNSNLDQIYSYNFNGENVQIRLNRFLQNETVLNPSEDINFKFLLQNLYTLKDINVKVSVKLVSLANEKWIIAENTSNPLNLKRKGDSNGGDVNELSVNLQMPELKPDGTWYGVNAPVRKAGAKMIATFYIENRNAGTYKSNQDSIIINQTDNKFEGYIIKLKSSVSSSIGILKHFKRDDCVYLPDNTTFIFNVFDKNYLSSYNQFVYSFGFKVDSQFSNITYTPKKTIYGEMVTLTSTLTTEFGRLLKNKTVSLYHYIQEKWEFLENSTTNSDGKVQFSFNSGNFELNHSEINVKLLWNGESLILNNSKEVTIPVINQNVNLSITYHIKNSVLYHGTTPVITVRISNIGDATLKIDNIQLDFKNPISYSIVQISQLDLENFKPNESTEVKIQLNVPNGISNHLNGNLTLTVNNLATIKTQTIKNSFDFPVASYPFIDYFVDYFIFIMLAIIGVIWISAIVYARKTIKKIETPEGKEKVKRPEKGRYLKVEEAQKEAEKEKETTDLDSLLEDEGLSEK